jgi:hypothetical protein
LTTHSILSHPYNYQISICYFLIIFL